MCVCVCVCASAIVWMSGMRHAWVRALVYMPCVGLCTAPPHHPPHPTPPEAAHPAPPAPPPHLHHRIKHYLQNNTISCETKRGFWASVNRESGSDRTWPVPLDPSGGGGGVVTRCVCVCVCVCMWGGVVSQGRDNPSSHGGPRVLGL